ncbi:MAG: signal peptide peptidase SppA [Bacteroidales bacterium]|nr:signal peptide peptidase SppA [Bacteroidales bacterium]
MKEFFKYFFAALAAMFVYGFASVGIYIVMMIMMFSMGGSGMSSKTKVEDNTVLRLRLNGTITDRSVTQDDMYGMLTMSLKIEQTTGLTDILRCIKSAKTDKKISAIYLEFSTISTDFANLQNIRAALEDFAESGKPIYAWAESYDLATYYLASTATKIYMRELGGLELKGIASQSMFYKPLLDRLGIDMQVIRHGKFKSAVEPYLQGSMSDANRLQMSTLVNDIWAEVSKDICKSKNIDAADFENHIDNLDYYSDLDLCVNSGMIDALISHKEAEDSIKAAIEVADDEELKIVSLTGYLSSLKDEKPKNDKIAIIYAEGEIDPSGNENSNILADKICEAFKTAQDDDDIKAVVFRINSPGGSATESEEIYKAAKAFGEKKPLVVSMGSYAASGGYYIACPAQKIVAMPSTITGSIGVFGVIPNVEKLLKDIDLNVETVGTHKHSGMGSMYTKMDSREIDVIQQSVETVYGRFISHVAEGRNMTTAEVDSIGQGRVWSGASALKIGLVDTLGSLNDALTIAAELADISDYSTTALPELSDDSMSMLLNLLSMKIFTPESQIPEELAPVLHEYERIKHLKGIQCRMEPFVMEY